MELASYKFGNNFQVAVYDWDDSSDPDLIGEFTTSVVQLKSGAGSQVIRIFLIT